MKISNKLSKKYCCIEKVPQKDLFGYTQLDYTYDLTLPPHIGVSATNVDDALPQHLHIQNAQNRTMVDGIFASSSPTKL